MEFEIGKTFEQLEMGEKAGFTKTITETDVYLFAGISGDFNPVHVNEEYAKQTPFGTRIAHGALPQSLIAPVLGTKLPGLGTVAVEISCRFKAPVFFGDTITATARVAEKLDEKKWVKMALKWVNQREELIAEGEAVVIPPLIPLTLTFSRGGERESKVALWQSLRDDRVATGTYIERLAGLPKT